MFNIPAINQGVPIAPTVFTGVAQCTGGVILTVNVPGNVTDGFTQIFWESETFNGSGVWTPIGNSVITGPTATNAGGTWSTTRYRVRTKRNNIFSAFLTYNNAGVATAGAAAMPSGTIVGGGSATPALWWDDHNVGPTGNFVQYHITSLPSGNGVGGGVSPGSIGINSALFPGSTGAQIYVDYACYTSPTLTV